MTKRPVIGKARDDEIVVDLPRLLETRMLVQSNSGGGKSWALRRLLEQTAPLVQQLIIDVEGEFTTLREKFDFVICAPHDGDAAATPQTAPVLARKLRELRVSAILDIHDLKAPDRQRFVRKFLDGLVHAPREHWNPALVVLDEAHLFAPEHGNKSESAEAVIDVATRGRKRGLALVAATQRLSKLHKDVAAELLNKLIGRTGLDVDVKRAADELGMTARDGMSALRDLEPGTFFAFGPALTPTVTRMHIGSVQTTHPRVGDRLSLKTPAPSSKVASILRELADLPKEAEQELETVETLRAENAVLKRQLAAGKKVVAPPTPGVSEAEIRRRIEAATAEARSPFIEALRKIESVAAESLKSRTGKTQAPPAVPRMAVLAKSLPEKPVAKTVAEGTTKPQQNILDAMAFLEALGLEQLHKVQVAAVAGVSPNSGSYANNLGRLRTMGMIDYPQPGALEFTPAGRMTANPVRSIPSLNDLHEAWIGIVTAPQARILQEVITAYPDSLSKVSLADAISVSPSSGSYANNLGRLRTLGIIDYPRQGYVRAQDILFPIETTQTKAG